MASVIGYKVPEEHSTENYLKMFRRAKTIDSLELMRDRKNRDISEADTPEHLKKVFEIEIYRAYVTRTEEIEAGKFTFSNSLGRALEAADGIAELAQSNKKAQKKDMPDLPAYMATKGVVSQGGKKSTHFSEAERALARELSKL
ncbi:hypothetical protein F7U66_01565 [Vibrio parahaemolyticus]|nr:hypothetical protein [Vibrio parahaemolyticus]